MPLSHLWALTSPHPAQSMCPSKDREKMEKSGLLLPGRQIHDLVVLPYIDMWGSELALA